MERTASIRVLPWVLVAGALLSGPSGGADAQEPVTAREVTVVQASGWLGINVTVLRAAGEPRDRIIVEEVFDGSPALEAGLRPGDRIVQVNGTEISGDHFRSLTRRLVPGDPMSLVVLRDGSELTLQLEAGERPDPRSFLSQRLQTELDEVRVRLARIVADSRVEVTSSGTGTATVHMVVPTIVVERVDGDSITTRVLLEGDLPESTMRIHYQTPQPSVVGSVDLTKLPDGERVPFSVWARSGDSTSAEQTRIRVVAPDAQTLSRRPVGDRSSVEAPEAPEAGEVVVGIRPLAPFLAGMNRVAGAEMRAMNPALATYFGVDSGVLVTSVAEDTPASQAGLRSGDVIRGVNGVEVSSVEGLREALVRFRVEPVLTLVRKGAEMTVRLR